MGEELEFVAIDFETANRHPGSPCQVGLALVRGGAVVATWGSLMQPPRGWAWFDADCVEVHGIAAAHVTDSPAFEELWPEIEARLEGRPIIAHNAGFDVGVIRAATQHCGFEWPRLDFACSMLMARRCYDLPGYGLDVVADAAGVHLHRHHDAVEDAVACALIACHMAGRMGVATLDGLVSRCGLAWGRLAPGVFEACRPDKAAAEAPNPWELTLF